MLNSKPTIKVLPLQNIISHQAIPFEVKITIGSMRYSSNYDNMFSQLSVDLLLKIHPLHVTLCKDGIASCFANLRLFQLAKTFSQDNAPTTVLVHNNIPSKQIAEISIADSYLTTLAFGLDNISWPFNILQLWKMMGKDGVKKYTPDLTSKTKLSEQIRINRSTLSSQKMKPESLLQKLLKVEI